MGGEEHMCKSLERMKILQSGGSVPCPKCKKGTIKKFATYHYKCDYCGIAICVDGEDILSKNLMKIINKNK